MDKRTLFVGGILVAGAAAVAVNFLQEPAASGGHSMAPPDTSTLDAGAPIAQVKLPATLSALAQSGKLAFEAKCSDCHGENATGLEGAAPPLVHKIYEPSHHGDQAFYLAAQNGVRAHHWRFGNMPPVEGLTRGDMKGIVAYIRELQRENGIN